MDYQSDSGASILSWNTFLSRTSVRSLSAAVFSEKLPQLAHGLSDVIGAVRSLNLPRFRYEGFSREEVLGVGETFLVERCVERTKGVVAVKHLKFGGDSSDQMFQRRLRSAMLELQIMQHPPLKAHPNITSGYGYGWNTTSDRITPFIVVEFASMDTLRGYVRKSHHPLSHIEILLGDVAAGLAALHVCGIVHGDIKLENVLVFPSMDRPAGALAKITDFGHALVLNDGSKANQRHLMYAGTFIYNAPEVKDQISLPIERVELLRCDMWAFGLLIWEACIRGETYVAHLKKMGLIPEDNEDFTDVEAVDLLKAAKDSVDGPNLGSPMFLRIALHKTLQKDPNVRVRDAQELPLLTRWNTNSSMSSLQAHLALHIEAPTPTYEVFRFDNGRDISWVHQRQILQSLDKTYKDNTTRDREHIIWQMALCYNIGFGTIRDRQKASELARLAKDRGHPVALSFSKLLEVPDHIPSQPSPGAAEEPYISTIISLIQSNSKLTDEMPDIVKAFYNGDATTAERLVVEEGGCLRSLTDDGCCALHWLFAFRDQNAVDDIVDMLLENVDDQLIVGLANLPTSTPREADCQWPLQLLGSPLAFAISVNSTMAVKALLRLGADPFSRVYGETSFKTEDPRLEWTAFHIAAKYHCSDILQHMIAHPHKQPLSVIPPLGCALSFPIHFAVQIASQRDVDETLDIPNLIISCSSKSSPSSLVSRDSVGRTPLHLAATGEFSLVSIWILHETPGLLLAEDYYGRRPLHYCKSAEICEVLLEKGSDVNHEDKLGMTAMHQASLDGEWDLVSCLLKATPNLKLEKNRYGTALHCGVINGSVDVVQALLGAGASPNATDALYNTPVHVAAKLDRPRILRILMDNGARIDMINMNGHDPVHVAIREGERGSEGALRVLQPRWTSRPTRHIMQIPEPHNKIAERPSETLMPPSQAQKLGKDFLWDKEELAIPTWGTVGSRSGQEQDDRTDGGVEENTREIIYETSMSVIETTLDNWDFTYPVYPWLVDCLVQSSLAFANDDVWHSATANHIGQVMARTAHDLALSFTGPFKMEHRNSCENSFVLEPDEDEDTPSGHDSTVFNHSTMPCVCGSKVPGHWNAARLMIAHMSQLNFALGQIDDFSDRVGEELINTHMVISCLKKLYLEPQSWNNATSIANQPRSFFRQSHHWLRQDGKKPSAMFYTWRGMKNKRRGVANPAEDISGPRWGVPLVSDPDQSETDGQQEPSLILE